MKPPDSRTLPVDCEVVDAFDHEKASTTQHSTGKAARWGAARWGDDSGVVAVMASMMMLPLFMGAAAIGIDIANWYYQGQKIQVAADAGALAGSVYMPGSLATSTTAARDASTRNGYVNGATSSVGTTSVTAIAGARTSQLRVTIRTPVKNFFGYLFGSGTEWLTRTAVAEYRGPVLMGSPCNLFGNEPPAGDGSASVAASGCATTPQFWANVAGPGAPKANGDQYATRACSSGNSGCTGNVNTDYNAIGYFYKVSVKQAMSSLTLQVFDPAMVHVNDHCGTNLPTTWTKDIPNPYSSVAGDAAGRYIKGDTTAYCTGDQEFDSNASQAVTTFAVREPLSSGDALSATVVPTCTQQYKGWGNSINFANTLDSTKVATYDSELARVFRQWVPLCTITNPTIGDYYIQVRTNLPMGTSSAAALSSRTEYPSVAWSGHNRYALRASVGSGSASNVSIAGYGYMSMYQNTPATNTLFYLSRISSALAGMTVDINLFDAGDAANPGTITILPPSDGLGGATALALTDCKGAGDVIGSAAAMVALNSSCQLTNVSSGSGWNGKKQTIRLTIPTNYTCNDSDSFGCWFRIRFQYPSGNEDTTTWSTDLNGQPVRLVE